MTIPTTAGAAAAQNEPIANQQRKISFATMQAQYKDHLRANGNRTDRSDAYLLSICQQYAREMQKSCLKLLNMQADRERYPLSCKAPNYVWDVSINYFVHTKQFFICLWQGAIMALQMPVFNETQIKNQDAFVDWFCYFGEFKIDGNFCVIKNTNGNPNETEANPVRDYFHTLLTTNL